MPGTFIIVRLLPVQIRSQTGRVEHLTRDRAFDRHASDDEPHEDADYGQDLCMTRFC